MNINKLKKDFLWYSIGAAIPMILNFIKSPIFTRYYNPSDYGNFTLINTTYSYINLFAFSWLISCVWRYYLREKNNKELNKFYTNIIVLFFIGMILVSAITIVWVGVTHDIVIKKLIIANFISLIVTAITTIWFTIIRLDGKSKAYNLYTIAISVLSFVILIVLAFILKNSIDAMLNCSNIVNVIFLLYIIYEFKKNYKLDKNYISKALIKDYLTYGFATVFFNMSLLLLTSGDRYVIQIFYSTDKVGIYNQIYNLSQISIVAFVNIFYSIINPYAFKLFEEDIGNEDEFYKYIFLYIICILPFAVYFSLYSKEIANLLLGEKFRIGYKMMPYVMITSFIYGLSDMHETHMKFKNKLRSISINLITASILNIALNFILIPIKGYEIAALTTLISYIYLYLMDVKADISNLNKVLNIFKRRYKLISSIFTILLFQLIFHYIIIKVYPHSSILFAVIEGTIFLLTFYTFIYIKFDNVFIEKKLKSKIKREVNIMKKLFKRRIIFLYKLNIKKLKPIECRLPVQIEKINNENIIKVLKFRDSNVEGSFKYMLKDGEIGIYGVLNDQVIAHVWCIINKDNRCKKMGTYYKTRSKVAYLHFCQVKEEFRGNNIYPYLLQNIIKIVNKKYNINIFYLDIDKNNIASQNGVEKLGAELYKSYNFLCVLDHILNKRIIK